VDLVSRCGIDKECVDAMRSYGLFDNLDEDAQISMISLLQYLMPFVEIAHKLRLNEG
jgi:hypothetical protein